MCENISEGTRVGTWHHHKQEMGESSNTQKKDGEEGSATQEEEGRPPLYFTFLYLTLLNFRNYFTVLYFSIHVYNSISFKENGSTAQKKLVIWDLLVLSSGLTCPKLYLWLCCCFCRLSSLFRLSFGLGRFGPSLFQHTGIRSTPMHHSSLHILRSRSNHTFLQTASFV